jgi:DNA polymerase III delta prime subunit
MKSDQFCYWLQGIFEGNHVKELDEKLVQTIKNHLKLVFLYDIDPSYTDDKVLQHIMQNVHDGKNPMDGVNATLKTSKVRPNNGRVRLRC